ncbi:transcription termination/antitermination protein NusG [Acetomicrobium sp.]|uniref:transcription termination/antitermination protein NusG n=1 Tax=Acetomicrobium sp. TaxID=1872099 RepID=UPI002871A288|nr:transcription termination/antitermination protein NusG [Acetomicrobium sp.]MDR9770130.1 transcription termination/antitermination protein NusG [Acetomicrobium sp.]HPT65357.1 transcription termination/antitermination protein NusG [Acetomicrobium sp.]
MAPFSVMIDKNERRWYVVQTYAGYENKVKANLEQRIATMGMEDKIFRVLVPIEERVYVKDGKQKRVKRKVFPGYILVEMILDDQSWYVVRHTPGVMGFVGAGNNPVPLSEREVQDIFAKIGKEQMKPKVEIDLKPGDVVRVRSGPFEGQVGTVVEVIPEKGKIKFSVTLFGRETIVEADYSDLTKI